MTKLNRLLGWAKAHPEEIALIIGAIRLMLAQLGALKSQGLKAPGQAPDPLRRAIRTARLKR